MKTTIRRTITLLASSAILAVAGGEALAQGVDVTQSYCIPTNDMSKLGGFEAADGEVGGTLSINGSAEILADGRMSLTNVSKTGGQAATFYYVDPVNFRYTDEANKINRQFHLFFSFSAGPNPDLTGGAGLSFLVQNNTESHAGSNADGLGYGGVKKSFQFEFDTKRDIPSAGTANFPDPMDDHIGFMLDGNQAEHPAYFLPKDGAVAAQFVSTTVMDASYTRWYVWIDYAGGTGADARVFKLYLSKTKMKPDMPIIWEEHPNHVGVDPLMPSLPSNFDPDYWLSTQMAAQPGQGWVGFSASTYSSLIENSHFIHEFEFSNKGIPCACQGADACKTATGTTACSAGPMTQNKGECVECTEFDPSPCTGMKPVCDPLGEVCVECNTNMECPTPTAPLCDTTSHTCVPCAMDDDCAPFMDTPICVNEGTPEATCGECDDNTDCKNPALPICDPTTNTCEECATNADCPADAPVCNPESKTCEPTCTTDEDCTSHPNEPACAMTGDKAGQCVPCTADKHCPVDKPTCDVATNTCEGCKTNDDCSYLAPVCDVAQGSCGDCKTDADCERFAETPSCILTGSTAGQCGPATPPPAEVIEGGGCACEAAGSSSSEGIFAGLLSALGVALAMGRRHRRSS